MVFYLQWLIITHNIPKFHYMTFKVIWNLASCSFSPECLPLSYSPDEHHLFCLCCIPIAHTVLLVCMSFSVTCGHSLHLCITSANIAPGPSYLEIMFDLINSFWELGWPFLDSIPCSINMSIWIQCDFIN